MKWNEMSIAEKAGVIKMFVGEGVKDVEQMRKLWDENVRVVSRDGALLPELTVTPNGNYYHNTYDDVKLYAEGGDKDKPPLFPFVANALKSKEQKQQEMNEAIRANIEDNLIYHSQNPTLPEVRVTAQHNPALPFDDYYKAHAAENLEMKQRVADRVGQEWVPEFMLTMGMAPFDVEGALPLVQALGKVAYKTLPKIGLSKLSHESNSIKDFDILLSPYDRKYRVGTGYELTSINNAESLPYAYDDFGSFNFSLEPRFSESQVEKNVRDFYINDYFKRKDHNTFIRQSDTPEFESIPVHVRKYYDDYPWGGYANSRRIVVNNNGRDEPDETLIHEIRHILQQRESVDDRIYNALSEKNNLGYDINERDLLNQAYEFSDDFLKKYDVNQLAEKGAENTNIRYQLYKKFKDKNAKSPSITDLNEFISQISESEIEDILSHSSGYSQDWLSYLNTLTKEEKSKKIDAIKRALIGVPLVSYAIIREND